MCGAAQSCTDGVVTSAAMCDASQACVTTMTTCPNACNAAGTDCVACPVGQTMCPDGCKNLANDPMNCGSCGDACAGRPSPARGRPLRQHAIAASSCNTGYLECGNRAYCQVRSWGFEDGTTGGFRIVGGGGASAVKSISTSTSVTTAATPRSRSRSTPEGSARRFEVGVELCDGGYLPAMGQTVSAWFYLSPASASVPAPHPDSIVGEHLYTTAGEGGNTTSPLPVGSWFRVQTPIASVGARLESFSLEGLFDSDGTNDFDWTGVVYVDDITIQ